MSADNEELKPLSFGNDEPLRPLTVDTSINNVEEDYIPISTGKSPVEIKNKNSNFVFFFGTPMSGKSVILSSILYYLNSQAGVLRPNPETPNSKEAKVLLSDFFENIRKGVLPSRTTRDLVTRLDFLFEPNNRSNKVPPINLTFLEASGENHNEIRRGGSYHNSIASYLKADIPLTFIIVTSYDEAHKDDTIINNFLDILEMQGKNPKQYNVILVVSKWDKSGKLSADATDLNNFIDERLSMTSQRIDTYGLNKTFYTIGDVQSSNGTEKVTSLSLSTAEVLSNWLYESIVGYPLDYEGTFWERLKFNFKS